MSRLVQKLTQNAPPGQVLRFLIVGASNTLFAYGLFCALNYLLTPRIASPYVRGVTASALGTVVCITVSFVCHKLFVFRTRGNFLKEYLRAFVVYGGTSLMGFALLPLVMAALKVLSIPDDALAYPAAAILTAGTVVVSFFGHKKYTFAQNPTLQVDTITESAEVLK